MTKCGSASLRPSALSSVTEGAYADAKQASRNAAERVKEAKARLTRSKRTR